MKICFTRCFLMLVLVFEIAAQAPPRLLPFQGRLVDRSGNTVPDGMRLVQFRIFDSPAGGSIAWEGEIHRVTVNGGMVNVILGTKTPLDRIDFNRILYLEVVVDANADGQITVADQSLLPRQSILPVLFAAESAKLAGYDWSVVFGSRGVESGLIPGDKLAPGSVSFAQLSTNVHAQLGSGSALQNSLMALEAIQRRDAVSFSRDSDNRPGLVRASATGKPAFFGFAGQDVPRGAVVNAQQFGPMSGFTNLVPGRSYYLGSIPGGITQDYPSGIQQYVGHALTENTLFVDPFGMSKSWASANHWGNGSDGDLVTGGNVSLQSPVDGPVVVRQYRSLSIRAGDTVTTSERCRGLVIYVDGDAVINGTLTMTARGANVDPALPNSIPPEGIRLVRKRSGASGSLGGSDLGGTGVGGVGSNWLDVERRQPGIANEAVIVTIARSAGGGGAGGPGNGKIGETGANGTGGGGSGAATDDAQSGSGGRGTCYSGGPGGGAAACQGSGESGKPNGGAGGAASLGLCTGGIEVAGGAGNPGGSSAGGAIPAENGTGGLLILFVRGNLTIGPQGLISADGSRGGDYVWPGGSSGGGRVVVVHGGTSNAGTSNTRAAGGASRRSSQGLVGGRGGDGTVTIEKVDP